MGTTIAAKTDGVSAQPAPRNRARLALPALCVIVGLLVMLYPVVSTVWNNHLTTKAAREYAELEQATPQHVNDQQWDAAHAYNEDLVTGPILDPWLAKIDEDNKAYAEYLDQLDTNEAMARLIFPEIDTDLPIFHGTKDETLQKGLGHLYGSDLPVGGAGTHSVITGHTGLSNATMFDNLKDAEEGYAFFIQVAGHKLKYVVDQIRVVLPNETDGLRPVQGKDYLTLITCTPYGINSHRLLVRGHAVPLGPGDEAVFDSSHGAGWQWWMYALVVAAVVVALGLLWWLKRQLAASKNRDADHGSADQTGDGEGEEEFDSDDAARPDEDSKDMNDNNGFNGDRGEGTSDGEYGND